LAADELATDLLPDDDTCRRRIAELCKRSGLTITDEPIINDAKNANFCILYGLDQFSTLFSPRQIFTLLALTAAIRDAASEMERLGAGRARTEALTSYLAVSHDRVANYCTVLCVWRTTRTCVLPTFSRQALPMVWDYGEMNLFAGSAGDWSESIDYVAAVAESLLAIEEAATVTRGSAYSLATPDNTLDAVITDPPYYDNVPYANISDFFYVWLKRTVGHLYPKHFSGQGTPKKQETVADATRHDGDKRKAGRAYEDMMAQSLAEANRVLKPGGALVVVYAHKTTLGWATLVDALRQAGFQVMEAWPINTEMAGGMRTEKASLASSIFLTARKRHIKAQSGSYETVVHPELEAIVRERVETLWDQGISGADLVIACVGAGLRAFTRFARVEYANGDEVPAERFLTEVETVVLDSILGRLSKEVGGKDTSLAGVDPATRFYTLWRYTYRAAELDAGEAIIFANGTHVELDGPSGMSSGAKALVEKKKGKYRLCDFVERGDDVNLGQPTDDGQAAPLVDVLHRVLWLMEHRPRELATFLRETEPNREQLRLVAQALAGPALKGGEMSDVSPTAEMAALAKLTSNWRSVIEDAATTMTERTDKKRGQGTLFE
jgi:putative DNA methylase